VVYPRSDWTYCANFQHDVRLRSSPTRSTRTWSRR
jgi:hypothetical protein